MQGIIKRWHPDRNWGLIYAPGDVEVASAVADEVGAGRTGIRISRKHA